MVITIDGNEIMRWVIAYDVTSNRNRRKIAIRLEQIGFRRQKSIFEGEASPGEIDVLLDELAQWIDTETDVLTAWPTVEQPTVTLKHRGVERSETEHDWLIL